MIKAMIICFILSIFCYLYVHVRFSMMSKMDLWVNSYTDNWPVDILIASLLAFVLILAAIVLLILVVALW